MEGNIKVQGLDGGRAPEFEDGEKIHIVHTAPVRGKEVSL